MEIKKYDEITNVYDVISTPNAKGEMGVFIKEMPMIFHCKDAQNSLEKGVITVENSAFSREIPYQKSDLIDGKFKENIAETVGKIAEKNGGITINQEDLNVIAKWAEIGLKQQLDYQIPQNLIYSAPNNSQIWLELNDNSNATITIDTPLSNKPEAGGALLEYEASYGQGREWIEYTAESLANGDFEKAVSEKLLEVAGMGVHISPDVANEIALATKQNIVFGYSSKNSSTAEFIEPKIEIYTSAFDVEKCRQMRVDLDNMPLHFAFYDGAVELRHAGESEVFNIGDMVPINEDASDFTFIVSEDGLREQLYYAVQDIAVELYGKPLSDDNCNKILDAAMERREGNIEYEKKMAPIYEQERAELEELENSYGSLEGLDEEEEILRIYGETYSFADQNLSEAQVRANIQGVALEFYGEPVSDVICDQFYEMVCEKMVEYSEKNAVETAEIVKIRWLKLPSLFAKLTAQGIKNSLDKFKKSWYNNIIILSLEVAKK